MYGLRNFPSNAHTARPVKDEEHDRIRYKLDSQFDPSIEQRSTEGSDIIIQV